MPDTRTGLLVEKLVEGIQGDISESVGLLSRGHDLIERLAAETKGVNGLSSMLKAKAQELKKMVSDLEEESKAVKKKMIGPSMSDEIKTSVDPSLARTAEKAAKERT